MNSIAIELLDTASVDACLVSSDYNMRFVTGFTGTDSQALVTRHGVTMFTDARYAAQAALETAEAVNTTVVTKSSDRIDAICAAVKKCSAAHVGFEDADMHVDFFRKLERGLGAVRLEGISAVLLTMREIKTPAQIEYIRTAAAATDEVMDTLAGFITDGVRECDILGKCLDEISKRAMTPSFEPIVAAGARGALPHASPTEYAVRSGDLVTIDFGCRFNGYCADMTRTLAVGHVDGTLKTIYDVVEQAQSSAENAARIGTPARTVDAVARDIITAAGYGPYFGHSTGHGVGLQIHELPMISENSEAVISEGMAFTIEPGIYIEGLGGVRIEDTVAAGIGSLFRFPKKLIEL